MNFFEKYIEKYFNFLINDFNFSKFNFCETVGRFESRKVAFTKNKTTAIKIEYEEYDFDFDIQLIILGQSKNYDEDEENDHTFIPLWLVLEERNSFWSKMIRYLYANPKRKYITLDERNMKKFCKTYAEAMEKTCKDLLSGNFEKLPKLKKYMIKRFDKLNNTWSEWTHPHTTNLKDGVTKVVGKDAVIVLNKYGKVITTWAKGRNGYRQNSSNPKNK